MAVRNLVLLILLVFVEFCYSVSINDKIVINNVARTLDLTSQLARVTLDITLQNTGSSSVNNFHLAVDPEDSNHLAFAGATVSIYKYIRHCH